MGILHFCTQVVNSLAQKTKRDGDKISVTLQVAFSGLTLAFIFFVLFVPFVDNFLLLYR